MCLWHPVDRNICAHAEVKDEDLYGQLSVSSGQDGQGHMKNHSTVNLKETCRKDMMMMHFDSQMKGVTRDTAIYELVKPSGPTSIVRS